MNAHRELAPGTHAAVARLLAGGTPSPIAISRFLGAHEFPLVEPGAVTFAWRGEADAVHLMRFIQGGPGRLAFARLPGTDLWLLRLPVQNAGRFEYKLAVARGGGEEWILDPLNPARADDPFGQNSVCRTAGYMRPAWSQPHGAPSGRVEDLAVESAAFGGWRTERIYLPAGYDPAETYPLLVVHDGTDYLSYADLGVSLDNLIEAGDIPPLVAALVQTGDRPGEYDGGRRHARYIVRELLPAVEARYAVTRRPEGRIMLGASLGAVATLATAFRYPDCFGGLVLKSGSFILDEARLASRPHAVFFRIARLVRAFRRSRKRPAARIFVSTGELEGLAGENRALASFLRARGVDVLFKSVWDGHHWHNWRDQLRDGLRWVLRAGDLSKG